METTRNFRFSVLIQPSSGWFDFNFKELVKYRDLLFLFIRRDFIVTHAQSILGPLWYVVTPLISTVVYVVIFGKIAQVPTDGLPYALFILSGLTLWNYFSAATGKIQDVLYLNAGIFGRVYFPRVILPLSYLVSTLVPYFSQMLTFFLVFLFFKFSLGANVQLANFIIFTPLVVLLTALLSLGLGLLISSVSYKYRDFIHISGFFLNMLMYASPLFYPASRIPAEYSTILFLNPMAVLLEAHRHLIFGVGSIPFDRLPQAIFTIFFIFLLGLVVFNRVQKTFVDSV